MTSHPHADSSLPATTDTLIVGAGLSGLYQLHRLRRLGVDCHVVEAMDDLGGTWYRNCYPGARVDIESIEFSYFFDDDLQQQWRWSERYAGQPELLAYLRFVADRYDLRPSITFGVGVTQAVWHDTDQQWVVTLDSGQMVRARNLVMAVGILSAPYKPSFAGIDQFQGEVHHSVEWPREGVDLSGKRVGLIGTGSTGVQVAPHLAAGAQQLTIFMRSAPYVVPAHNHQLSDNYVAEVRSNYASWRAAEQGHFGGFVAYHGAIGSGESRPTLSVTDEERTAEFDARWDNGGLAFYSSFPDLLVNEQANELLADYLRGRIRDQVADEQLRETLTPKDFMPLTRRLVVSDDFYPMFERDNVSLINVRNNPIATFTPTGIRLEDGTDFELDAVVLATGFDPVTGPALSVDVQGRNGLSLAEHWADGPQTLLGMTTAGFPNFYFINGPGTPGALTQAFVLSQFNADWIADAIAFSRDNAVGALEAKASEEQAWTEHLTSVFNSTLMTRAASWYTGANVPGRAPRAMLYLGGYPPYKARCLDAVAGSFAEFEQTPAVATAAS